MSLSTFPSSLIETKSLTNFSGLQIVILIADNACRSDKVFDVDNKNIADTDSVCDLLN